MLKNYSCRSPYFRAFIDKIFCVHVFMLFYCESCLQPCLTCMLSLPTTALLLYKCLILGAIKLSSATGLIESIGVHLAPYLCLQSPVPRRSLDVTVENVSQTATTVLVLIHVQMAVMKRDVHVSTSCTH